jgi:alkanesulfonate monooxygenase SsuD/methylene tetrahydromethanopterin reductase-like flavin-dependent oxidoreductase (luciferase family)
MQGVERMAGHGDGTGTGTGDSTGDGAGDARIDVGVAFGPSDDWAKILAAAKLADELGLASVGFWDGYHSIRPEWGWLTGWSAYGAIARETARIRLLPMVLCADTWPLGVIAKEGAVLSIISGGRFDLGIGTGDFHDQYPAWGIPREPVAARRAALAEQLAALRQLWTGVAVDVDGEHVRLRGAAVTPPPPVMPRIVVGAGTSRGLIDVAAAHADEVNLYAKPELFDLARERIAASGRDVTISVFGERPGDQPPTDLPAEIARWRDLGASRYVLTAGFGDDLSDVVRRLADAAATVHAA